MKKIYTLKLTMMAILSVLSFGFLSAQGDCPPPEYDESYFWGTEPGQGDFSDGFGDWTTVAISDDPSEDWEIAPDGFPVVPEFFGGTTEFTSPTACNGVAHYSFLKHQMVDNPDLAQPYLTYSAELISPVIDCSGRENVTLEYWQAYNRLNDFGTFSWSINGGDTWSQPEQLSYEGAVNSAVDIRKVILSMPQFDGEAECRFKFTAFGDFYYLSIDDVVLKEESTPDLYTSPSWAAGAINYGTPFSQVQPMPLLVDVFNQSGVTAYNSTLTANIYDLNTAERVFTTQMEFDSIRYGRFETGEVDVNGDPIVEGDAENKVFGATFTPEAEPGKEYLLEYIIFNQDDLNHANDTVTTSFAITDSIFMKVIPPNDLPDTPRYLSFNRFGATDPIKSYGTQFYVEESTSPDDRQGYIEAVRLGFGPESGQDGQFTTGAAHLEIFSWVDIDDNGIILPTEEGTPEITLLGSARVNLTSSTDPEEMRDIVLVPETDEGSLIPLTDDTEYIALLTFRPFDEAENYRIYYNSSEVNRQFYDQPASYAYGEIGIKTRKGSVGRVTSDWETRNEGEIFKNSWGTFFINPHISDLKFEVDVNEINDNLNVQVYPTLANDNVTVEFNLDELSSSVVTDIVDMNGKAVYINKFYNVQTSQETLNVSNLPAGSYIVNIRTDNGMTSKKITVIR